MTSQLPTLTFLVLVLAYVHGFAIQQRQPAFSRTKSALDMMSLESPETLLTLSSPLLSVDDSLVASELMGDASIMSDVVESNDFFDFSNTPLVIQTFAIMGRLLCIASDFIPDHHIVPSEFVYQSVMLSIASAGIINTVKEMRSAKKEDLTSQDRESFESLFRPAGISWSQYKQMSREGIFEWIEMSPGSIITGSEVNEQRGLYWLQSGNLEIEANGSAIRSMTPRCRHLVGDFSPLLSTTATGSQLIAETTVKVGSDGATMLHIDAEKLKDFLESNRMLHNGMRNMLLNGMQRHVATLLSGTGTFSSEGVNQQRSCLC